MKPVNKSLGVKLWLYFILFAAAILLTLWLLQTVFLSSFYQSMKINDIKNTALTIISEYGQDDFTETVDRLTYRNSILVFITDLDGNVVYTSDEHGSGITTQPDSATSKLYSGYFRSLPAGFDRFLLMLLSDADGQVFYTQTVDGLSSKSMIFGALLSDAILYISAPIEPVNATVDILRTQLLYVTILSLTLSAALAFLIARRFAKPVGRLSKQAAKLAQGDYNVSFDKGFCAELDELAVTLDHTADELEKTENLRRELMANVSHDLRTPLTMIKAYSEMIRDISGDNKEKREANLKIITEETDRLSMLVTDLLDLSSIQSGHEIVKRAPINISQTVERVLSRFRPLAELEGVNIEAQIEPDRIALIDERRMEQVLYNLLGNAMSYVGEDRKLIIRLFAKEGFVRFEVADHGEGIPEGDLPHIWDRYYKAKGQKRSTVSTGLGLSIVKEVLVLHGAKYGADSRVGEGSVFWFEVTQMK